MAVPPTCPTADTKAALRVAMRRARAEFVATLTPVERRPLEEALAARVAPLLIGRSCIAGYAALTDEIDPARLAFDAWPRVAGRAQPLTFHHAQRADLKPGTWGIREPAADAPRADPDALLLPLLAADARGTRLGYGAGHYDRTLAASSALRIGVAWDCQVVDALPADAWDLPLDWLVTPTRTLDCRAAARAVGAGAAER